MMSSCTIQPGQEAGGGGGGGGGGGDPDPDVKVVLLHNNVPEAIVVMLDHKW